MEFKLLITTLIISLVVLSGCTNKNDSNQRQVISLKQDWKFTLGDQKDAQTAAFNDSQWDTVEVPHDWAIYGPFDKNNDVYKTVVYEDGETVPQIRLGRTGGLPYMGVGWYRKSFNVPENAKNKKLFVEFDGAMSHAKVYFNGAYIGEWPYGYTSFSLELTDHIKFGENNVLAVRLENKPKMSRWYPGAGLYRNVRLVYTPTTHIAHWGTNITTPRINEGDGTVNIKTTVKGNSKVSLLTEIYSPEGKLLKSKIDEILVKGENITNQDIKLDNPQLWSIETPKKYKVLSKIIVAAKVIDTYESSFGFRYFEFTADDGFHLNGKRVQIQGVCMHHDLGPIGAAVNKSAINRQLRILKEMGCNAIRTSHNPPSPEYLAACDSLGFIVMDESFDEWKQVKVDNGYNTLWEDWRKKDLTALIHRDRNHPSVVMWSVGNEIREQHSNGLWTMAKSLVDICHEEDPTRPVTIGMNNYEPGEVNKSKPSENKFAAQFDVKGWNYYADFKKIHEEHPYWVQLACETQSTVSTRGFYDLDAVPKKHYVRDNLQCSAYGNEYPSWANSPDVGFARLDDNPFVAGEFVWTGFDYLGEPTPYNTQWPTRSSYFGIIDFAGFPKDIYYLYQQRWSDKEVLHILPHWNWKEGQNVPIHVFTNYNSAELFVNGKSYGIRKKDSTKVYGRYRLIWDRIAFKPGLVKVKAIDKNGNYVKEATMETAGPAYKIKLISDGVPIKANGEDLAFIEVQIVDKEGRVCPLANNMVYFKVEGNGKFRAAGNGNPTDVEPFHSQKRKCFFGKSVAMIQVSKIAGEIKLIASADNLISGEISIISR